MKDVWKILPFALVGVAAVTAVYYLWYKPAKDREAAQYAGEQAEHDAELNVYNPTGKAFGQKSVTAVLAVKTNIGSLPKLTKL